MEAKFLNFLNFSLIVYKKRQHHQCKIYHKNLQEEIIKNISNSNKDHNYINNNEHCNNNQLNKVKL